MKQPIESYFKKIQVIENRDKKLETFTFYFSTIPLYIKKNPVEKLCKVLEMELKMYTPVNPKFVFEKIKFKVLHYIQRDFIRQRPGLGIDQTSMLKSLVIN